VLATWLRRTALLRRSYAWDWSLTVRKLLVLLLLV